MSWNLCFPTTTSEILIGLLEVSYFVVESKIAFFATFFFFLVAWFVFEQSEKGDRNSFNLFKLLGK